MMNAVLIEKPNMWLAHNEKLNLFIHRPMKMTGRRKANGINENQPRVTKVEGGYVYTETLIHITSIEDREDYWYIGYRPIGKDAGACTFGFTRLYKNMIPEYGTISIEDATNIDIRTGKAK